MKRRIFAKFVFSSLSLSPVGRVCSRNKGVTAEERDNPKKKLFLRKGKRRLFGFLTHLKCAKGWGGAEVHLVAAVNFGRSGVKE